jgi:hypothetical protein
MHGYQRIIPDSIRDKSCSKTLSSPMRSLASARVCVARDGNKLIRVWVIPYLLHGEDMLIFSFLDAKDQNQLEYKLDTSSSVYRQLGKDVHLE